MIRFADQNTSIEVRRMWKTCFNDPDEFLDIYFHEKYKNENTLLWIEDGQVVASIQILPYIFTFCNIEIPVGYISGACTLPEYRNRGYMSKLLLASFDVMRQRNIPLSVLIPAEDWLYGYYAGYGYERVFDSGEKIVPLKEIYEQTNKDIDVAYQNFDILFRKRDFCVQKSKKDFITIIKDAILYGFPSSYNVAGMARIIDAELLLSYFAKTYPDKFFICKIDDKHIEMNNFTFEIKNGSFIQLTEHLHKETSININTLCRLLFGYHLDEFPDIFAKNFVPHEPVMNLMLE
ncbi:MAG: GNAT family N-acetyltransferase [Bacteroidales bacterium]|jgi:predicted acetyltransferase|nr:GNAT family N-acetyltransferase [Bacteroidales bacterium]